MPLLALPELIILGLSLTILYFVYKFLRQLYTYLQLQNKKLQQELEDKQK